MRTINKVILIGNITRDPLVKDTEWGKKIAMFTIATNRYYKNGEGEQKSEVEFHNCVAWWALAEKVQQFVTTGKLVYTEWRLKTRVIEKENGEKNYKTEIIAWNIIFLNKRWEFSEKEDSGEVEDDDMF